MWIFQIGIKDHLYLGAYCVLETQLGIAHTSSQGPFTLLIISRLAHQTA